MIYNPGNADYAGFRIIVTRSGQASFIDGTGPGHGQLAPGVVASFFQHISAAAPLKGLPAAACATTKDPSLTAVTVNAAIIVQLGSDASPDLSCATDARATALRNDAQTVQHALYVQAYRTRPGGMMFGGQAVGGSQPPPPSSSGGGMGGYGGYGPPHR